MGSNPKYIKSRVITIGIMDYTFVDFGKQTNISTGLKERKH